VLRPETKHPFHDEYLFNSRRRLENLAVIALRPFLGGIKSSMHFIKRFFLFRLELLNQFFKLTANPFKDFTPVKCLLMFFYLNHVIAISYQTLLLFFF
jgi:hypothetical protein